MRLILLVKLLYQALCHMVVTPTYSRNRSCYTWHTGGIHSHNRLDHLHDPFRGPQVACLACVSPGVFAELPESIRDSPRATTNFV